MADYDYHAALVTLSGELTRTQLTGWLGTSYANLDGMLARTNVRDPFPDMIERIRRLEARDFPAPPQPAITTIDPTSRVIAPTDDVVLHVHGTGFVGQSVIEFGDNKNERTDYVSATEVTTIIRGDLFTGVDPAVPVRVHNGTKVSNEVTFAFTEPGG